jgi:aspartyl-tRNA(Asn)/glutamyl-tRNA(Gln) amidotransferase subunit C
MRVERQEILKLAKLARLEFSDAELEKMQASLGGLVEYLDMLKQLNLEGVEPMTAVDLDPRPLRPDVEGVMLSKEAALPNAPSTNPHQFSIPKVNGG